MNRTIREQLAKLKTETPTDKEPENETLIVSDPKLVPVDGSNPIAPVDDASTSDLTPDSNDPDSVA